MLLLSKQRRRLQLLGYVDSAQDVRVVALVHPAQVGEWPADDDVRQQLAPQAAEGRQLHDALTRWSGSLVLAPQQSLREARGEHLQHSDPH